MSQNSNRPCQLYVSTYHYVRNLPATRFPGIKGMLLDDFRGQVKLLKERYEMASLESTLAYLSGEFQPTRDLCLMTFDDGLKEHYADVTPVLVEERIQGLFFVITSCLEEKAVASVHMNHFLMAHLGFAEYRRVFTERLAGTEAAKNIARGAFQSTAAHTYPLDTTEVAEFKYLFNFLLPFETRDEIVRSLFVEHLGSESAFANELYVTWKEARQMQAAGMIIGGHTHRHLPLAKQSGPEMQRDLQQSRSLMNQQLAQQPMWPFSYPYGKRDSYNDATVDVLKSLGFCCSFTTEAGNNLPGHELFSVHRLDGQHDPAFRSAAQSRN